MNEFMFELIFDFVKIVLAISIHEIGHYMMFQFYGLEPYVEFSFMKIEVNHPAGAILLPKQYFNILWVGIVAGIPFVLGNPVLFWFYFLCSSADIINIIEMSQHLKTKKSIFELNVEQVKKQRKAIRDYKNGINNI